MSELRQTGRSGGTLEQHGYQAMSRRVVRAGDLLLRAVSRPDIESIRVWRNAQMDVLRQAEEITTESQAAYFEQHVWPEWEREYPGQILLAIERNRELIGYGGLVHISWPYRRAEVSFLLKPDLERNASELSRLFGDFLELIQGIGFADLGLKRLSTETYAHRATHIRALEAAGFRREGTLRSHVVVAGRDADAVLHGKLVHEWRSRSAEVPSPSVLVTSASKKVPMITELRRAGHRVSPQLDVVAGDIDSLVVSQFAADKFWEMPSLDTVCVPDLIEECSSRGIRVIFPTRDGELEFWGLHKESFAAAGIDVVVSSCQAIRRCRDKLEFARFGAKLGLPMIPASDTLDGLGAGPFVVKEQFGAGSRGIALRVTREGALHHADLLREPIFQPFIEGQEISVDSWVSCHGDIPGVILRTRDRVVWGESQVTTTFRHPRLEAQAIEVLQALELRGPVVLQAIVVSDNLHVIECNPRFGGASTASIAAGLDSLFWSLDEALGSTKRPVFLRAPDEVRQIRMPVDHVIHGSRF